MGLGADVVYFKGFRDHYQYSQGDIEALTKRKNEQGADYVVTTEKDWSRISPFASMYHDLAYLRIKFAIVSGQDKFFGMIKDKMAEKRDKTQKK
jgi:tetraacyldisaccharide 4'-kinase